MRGKPKAYTASSGECAAMYDPHKRLFVVDGRVQSELSKAHSREADVCSTYARRPQHIRPGGLCREDGGVIGDSGRTSFT